jgi:serralysin
VSASIQLANLFMQALGAGALDPDAFHIGAAAVDAEDRIIYNEVNGNLSYDADGVGGAAATHFAIPRWRTWAFQRGL